MIRVRIATDRARNGGIHYHLDGATFLTLLDTVKSIPGAQWEGRSRFADLRYWCLPKGAEEHLAGLTLTRDLRRSPIPRHVPERKRRTPQTTERDGFRRGLVRRAVRDGNPVVI